MALPDNTYSRVVTLLKIVFPLLALAGLSSLFLVARPIDPAQSIPYADVDIDQLTREQRIGGPEFSGVAANGAAYTLTAARAWPDPTEPGSLAGEDFAAAIDLPSGMGIDVTSGGAVLHNATQTAGLLDGVLIETTDGYRLEAQDLSFAFSDMRVQSDTPIVATGPGLSLEAGTFALTGDGTRDAPYLLVFKKGVKLLYGGQN